MRLRSRQRGQTLIIIFVGAFLLGGAATGLMNTGKSATQLRKEIGRLVPDEDRALRLDGVIARIEKEAGRFRSEHARLGREALELIERHDAKPEEFERLFRQADALDAASRKTLLDLRFELRQGLSPEDWRSLFSGK